jgi:hypothetical protein
MDDVTQEQIERILAQHHEQQQATSFVVGTPVISRRKFDEYENSSNQVSTAAYNIEGEIYAIRRYV